MPAESTITGVDTAAVDTSAVDTSTVDTSTGTGTESSLSTEGNSQDAEATPEGDEQQQLEQKPEDTTAGEALPGAVKAAIDALKQSNPAGAKEIRAMFYREKELLAQFPGGIKEATGLKQAVEQYGGVDGVKSLAADAQTLDGIDSKLAQGDATLLSEIEQQFPGALGKMMPDAIATFSKSDPEGYDRYMSGVIVGTLDQAQRALGGASITGVLNHLVKSLSGIKDTDGNIVASQEIEYLQAVLGAVDGLRDLAQKAPAEKKIDPERQKFEEERKAFEAQKEKQRVEGVFSQLNAHNRGATSKLLKSELTRRGTTLSENDEEYGIIVKEIANKAIALMQSNQDIVKKLNAMELVKDDQGIVTFMKSNFDKYLPNALESVMKRYDRFGGGGKKAAPKPVEQPTGTQKLNEAPAQDKIDYARTTRAMLMNGQAYLKGQKNLYTWM